MKRLVIKKGFARLDYEDGKLLHEWDVNRIVLDDLVTKGLVTTSNCCDYNLNIDGSVVLTATSIYNTSFEWSTVEGDVISYLTTNIQNPTCGQTVFVGSVCTQMWVATYNCTTLAWSALQISNNFTASRTVYVDPDGDDASGVFGSASCPFATIEAAIAAVVANNGFAETIVVNPGNYTVTSTILIKNVSSFCTMYLFPGVRITGGDLTILDLGDSSSSFKLVGEAYVSNASDTLPTVRVHGSTAKRIEGLTIKNQGLGSCIEWEAGAMVNSVIRNTTLLTNGSYSISSDAIGTLQTINSVANTDVHPDITLSVHPLTIEPLLSLVS